ncbi:MAG TPA: nucleotide sugar dehydrogenase [Planctomycetota bacterium]|nr:nucleotide sugar dehydrogenase [Planctomycetota bacterium]
MLLEKIESRSAVVGVLGLGYVGLPLASAFVEAGFRVLGFDTDPSKIEQLARGEQYLRHLGSAMTTRMRQSGRFEATSDFSRLGEADAILICVPTPLGEYKEPDLSYIERSGEAIAKTLRRGQMVVLESTTYPGTTRDFLRPILERDGLKAGVDFLLAFSPEREDPGRKDFDTRTIPKLVGGTCEASGAAAHALYAAAVKQAIRVSSAEVAESAKLLENIFRSINIALVNELKVILDAMKIDVWEVIDAASTKPFGFMRFTPGPGLGGHCIPIDPFYLTWVARRAGHATKFIELAGEINTRMPHYVVEKTMLALNTQGKAVNGAKVLVLGLAYKPDVDDVRESPAIELIELFEGLGASVRYADPHVPVPPRMREHDLRHHVALDLDPATIASFDVVVVATDHRAFDWDMIANHARSVVDTRNALASRMSGRPNYTKA